MPLLQPGRGWRRPPEIPSTVGICPKPTLLRTSYTQRWGVSCHRRVRARRLIDWACVPTRRTHTRGRDAPLADYAGFGMPVLAPADGRVVEVTDHYADNPPGTNSDDANYLVIAIDVDRYVSMAHLQQGSVTVAVGDSVHRGQQLAAVGNNGHSSAPHLHFQVQDSPAGSNADRTYPMLFRDVHITRSGPWPWGDTGDLRTGDLIRSRR